MLTTMRTGRRIAAGVAGAAGALVLSVVLTQPAQAGEGHGRHGPGETARSTPGGSFADSPEVGRRGELADRDRDGVPDASDNVWGRDSDADGVADDLDRRPGPDFDENRNGVPEQWDKHNPGAGTEYGVRVGGFVAFGPGGIGVYGWVGQHRSALTVEGLAGWDSGLEVSLAAPPDPGQYDRVSVTADRKGWSGRMSTTTGARGTTYSLDLGGGAVSLSFSYGPDGFGPIEVSVGGAMPGGPAGPVGVHHARGVTFAFPVGIADARAYLENPQRAVDALASYGIDADPSPAGGGETRQTDPREVQRAEQRAAERNRDTDRDGRPDRTDATPNQNDTDPTSTDRGDGPEAELDAVDRARDQDPDDSGRSGPADGTSPSDGGHPVE